MSHSPSDEKARVAVVMLVSVAAVEAFVNVFRRMWIDQPPSSIHAAQIAADLDNKINLVAPITTHYQEPGDYQNETGHSVSISLGHDFDNDMRWNFGFRDVSIAREGGQRRVTQLLAVRGYDTRADTFALETLYSGSSSFLRKFSSNIARVTL